jgi:hypothetical protein
VNIDFVGCDGSVEEKGSISNGNWNPYSAEIAGMMRSGRQVNVKAMALAMTVANATSSLYLRRRSLLRSLPVDTDFALEEEEEEDLLTMNVFFAVWIPSVVQKRIRGMARMSRAAF